MNAVLDHHVLTESQFQACCETWALNDLVRRMDSQSHTIRQSFRQLFRFGDDDALDILREPDDTFAAQYSEIKEVWLLTIDRIRQRIESLMQRKPALKGMRLNMPFLPLGDSVFAELPLRNGRLLSLGLLKLCEASALLHEQGYTRLPPLDRHPFAWHRFVGPEPRWHSPVLASRSEFTLAFEEVSARLAGVNFRCTQLDAMTYVTVDSYLSNNKSTRLESYLKPPRQRTGIALNEWNSRFGGANMQDFTRIDLNEMLDCKRPIEEQETFEIAERARASRELVLREIRSLALTAVPCTTSLTQVSPVGIRLLRVMASRDQVSISEISYRGKRGNRQLISKSHADREIKRLIQQGHVEKIAHGQYQITEQGRKVVSIWQRDLDRRAPQKTNDA